MPSEVTAHAKFCAVQTDQYIDRQFRPTSDDALSSAKSHEMETAKMAVALKIIGLDTLGKGAPSKTYALNIPLTSSGVNFFNQCMKGDPVLATPQVPNLKPSAAQQK